MLRSINPPTVFIGWTKGGHSSIFINRVEIMEEWSAINRNMSHPEFFMIARLTSERSNIRRKRIIFLGRPQRGRLSKGCSGIMCDLSEVDNALSWPNAINI